MLCIDLSDKKALITGSTRGIGRAIAEYLAKAGAFVVITGRDEERAQQVAKSISDKAIGVAMDLSDPNSIKSAYERIEKEVGPVDIPRQQRRHYKGQALYKDVLGGLGGGD
jgi:3-oxoacyl-[acyl-carrier protein] reductase